MDLGLKGKKALVTGGSRGIGRCIALALAAEGCAVGICARGEARLQEVVAEIEERGVKGYAYRADVTRPEEIQAFVDAGAAELGGVDILVNNAGGSAGGTLLEASDEDWSRTFDLNLFHAVRATRAVVPHMRLAGGGAVVVIASISGWKPGPRTQYGAAKAAEIFLAGGLALELAQDNIRVNSVAPGSIYFDGGGWQRFADESPEEFTDFTQREFPAQRLGRPEEVADVVSFLVSQRAAWINGAMVPVDGGQGRPSAF
jgi:3-oxoacyl-[acyl-carrier protein] reductase